MQLLFLVLLFPLLSHAQTVPHYLNFQTIVTDKDGNLIQEPFIDLEFQILDNAGGVVYYERQESVQVIKGVVNVTIGEGFVPGSSPRSPTGGISLSSLHPDNRPYYLRMIIGTDPPKEDLELLSVPYSMWAERALSIVPNSIGSEEIKNSSIKLEDLEPGLSFSDISGTVAESQLPSTLAMDTDITSHQTAAVPHSARQISVRGPYLATDPTNVEDVLQALDRRIMTFYMNQNEFRENTETALQANIDTEETARTTADTELTERIGNKKTISGSQDIYEGHSAYIIVRQERAGAPVELFLMGGIFSPAHYSELREHTHVQSSHDHGGATGSESENHVHVGITTLTDVGHRHNVSGTTSTQSVGHRHTLRLGGDTDQDVVDLENGLRGDIPHYSEFVDNNGTYGGPTYVMEPDSDSGYFHSHSFDVLSGDATDGTLDHRHSFGMSEDQRPDGSPSSHIHGISSVAPSILSTGIATGIPASALQKTYLDGMTIFIDGVDRTSDLLILAAALNPSESWTRFGDGSSAHALNQTSTPDPGTGFMDASSFFHPRESM